MTLDNVKHPPESTLRLVLRTNATTSGLGGLAALTAGGPVDDLLGTGQVGLVRLVGAGLALFAIGVAIVSRFDRRGLLRHVPGISVGDASWVAGTIVAITLGWFSTGGAITMAVIAVMVGVFGIEQALLVRRLATGDDPMPSGRSSAESPGRTAPVDTRRT
jgi:hypothetical protein